MHFTIYCIYFLFLQLPFSFGAVYICSFSIITFLFGIMILDDLCLKLYFWPVLSYLANLKTHCSGPPGLFPIIVLPPASAIPFPTLIPTYQPTPITTTATCLGNTLICLVNGLSPNPKCPCIDPRQPINQLNTAIGNYEQKFIQFSKLSN